MLRCRRSREPPSPLLCTRNLQGKPQTETWSSPHLFGVQSQGKLELDWNAVWNMARVLSELSIQDPSLLETDLKQAASTYYHTILYLKMQLHLVSRNTARLQLKNKKNLQTLTRFHHVSPGLKNILTTRGGLLQRCWKFSIRSHAWHPRRQRDWDVLYVVLD